MSASVNKRHISIAVILGFVLGSSVTYATLQPDSKLQVKVQTELRQNNDQLRSEIVQLQQSLDALEQQNQSSTQVSTQQQQKIAELTQQLDELNAQKKKVEKTLIVQKEKAVSLKTENKVLTETTELQEDLYDQSHELFEKKQSLQEQIAKLSKTREKLQVQNEKFIEDCKLFKEGTSWDAKSDSCAKQKLATEQLGKLDASIKKKKQELTEVTSLIEKLGVNS